MPNLVQTYVMHDSDKTQGGAKRINRLEAKAWNEKGYGIFHTVNYFFLDRKKTSLRGVNAWAIDIDEGTKEQQMAKIKRGLVPTLIVEVKRGYHVYWKAKDGTVETWKPIVWDRLTEFYGADKNAKDISRILRVPGFFHLKDPADPFLVKKVFESRSEYTAWEMLSFYPDPHAKRKEQKAIRSAMKQAPMSGSFWDNVSHLDCEYALEKLSGTEHVGCEIFSFRTNNSGTKNIFVNGKSSSCWIDSKGKIGSFDQGGPTIAQYLNWYHKDYKKVVAILEEVFPKLKESKTASQMSLL